MWYVWKRESNEEGIEEGISSKAAGEEGKRTVP
jgi:hypothetical protein